MINWKLLFSSCQSIRSYLSIFETGSIIPHANFIQFSSEWIYIYSIIKLCIMPSIPLYNNMRLQLSTKLPCDCSTFYFSIGITHFIFLEWRRNHLFNHSFRFKFYPFCEWQKFCVSKYFEFVFEVLKLTWNKHNNEMHTRVYDTKLINFLSGNVQRKAFHHFLSFFFGIQYHREWYKPYNVRCVRLCQSQNFVEVPIYKSHLNWLNIFWANG